jgi:hypothetical protein
MLYLLNSLVTPINFDKEGEAEIYLKKVSAEEAREIIHNAKTQIESAIGHLATSSILSEILGIKVEPNRKSIFLEKGDTALHFFLKTRIGEGVILTTEELRRLEYWLVLSKRIK